jgi:hypothetical protein
MRLVLRLVAFSLLVFGLPILISQKTLAQTVVRVAPPPPVRVGVVGKPPGIGYVWIEGTNAGTAKNICGSQGVGFAPRALVQSGWPPPGCDNEMGGYLTRDTGADH